MVGDVLQLVGRRHIAEREDVTRGGPLVFVDDDPPVVDSIPASRRPAGRRSDCRPVATSIYRPGASTVVELQHVFLGAVFVGPDDVVVGAHVPLVEAMRVNRWQGRPVAEQEPPRITM